MREPKNRPILFNTTEAQFAALRAAAGNESLSALVRRIIQEWLAANAPSDQLDSDQPSQ